MRKIGLLILLATSIFFTACEKYEEYELDFEYSAVYFPIQKPVRTVVAMDDMAIQVGVVLGGKRYNDRDEQVSFKIDESLLADTEFTLLPEDYYTLSNDSVMVIPQGSFQGLIDMKLDSAKFADDLLAIGKTYALPLVISGSTADSVLVGEQDPSTGEYVSPAKDYTILVIKYINQFHGYYYHKSVDVVYDNTSTPIDTVVYSQPDLVKNSVWSLSTSGGDNVTTNGIGNNISDNQNNYSMKLVVDGDQVEIESVEGSKVTTVIGGESTFDKDNGSFYLKYSYQDDLGQTHQLTDTLIFRNDGIKYEEW